MSLSLGTAIDPTFGTDPASEVHAIIAGPLLLIGFPLMALAAARFARAQSGGRDHGPVLDSAILTIAFTAVISESAFALHGWVVDGDPQELAQTILMAGGASWTVAMSVRLFLAGGHRAVSGWAILASSVMSLSGVTIVAWSGGEGGVPIGTLACWAAGVILLGISALHPSMRVLTEEADFATAHVRTRSLLLGAALLAPPIAILFRTATGGRTAVIASVAAALTAPMVVLRFADLLRQAERAHQDAEFQMLHDPLTQLPNRRLLGERLEQALLRRHQPDRQVAVLFLDLNGFKAINDAHGHAAGDQLLIETARRLQQVSRPADTVARFAGDEFVVVLEEVTPAAAVDAAERIHAALTDPVELTTTTVTIGASIGIALSDQVGHEPGVLMSEADMAMYRAKQLPDRRIEVAVSTAQVVALDATGDTDPPSPG